MTDDGRSRVLPAVVTVVLGSLIAVQSRVNGELSHHVGTGLFPAWLTMSTGLPILALMVLSTGRTRAGVGLVRKALAQRTLPWMALSGGVFGSLFLVTQSVTVPLVGVAVFTVGVVAGQTAGSLVVDRMGLSGGVRRAITARRIGAAVLAVVAVAVGVSDRVQSASGVLVYAGFALLAGALIAPQQAFNGRVGVVATSPFVAAFVNFAGGALVLSVVLAAVLSSGRVVLHDPTGAPWWAYAGGPIGLTVIVGAAWAVPVLGVLMFSLLSVLGQLSGALVLDIVAPSTGASVGVHLMAGVALTFVAVLVAAPPRRSG